MEPWRMGQQMIDFYKATFDNSFKAMTMLQEQNEQMVELFLKQSSWLPDEGRKAIADWIASYKKGRDEFKRMVDEGFRNVESFFGTFKKE
jgi:hypothetical protein